MAQIKVVSDLVPIEYYTALDPYYYIVDNRPLENLATNQQLIAEAVDNQAGNSARDALAVAAVGYAMAGYGDVSSKDGHFIGTWGHGNNRILNFGFGFATRSTTAAGGYERAEIAVLNSPYSQELSKGSSGTISDARRHWLVGTFRPSEAADEFYSETSPVQVLDITYMEGSNDVSYDPTVPFDTTPPSGTPPANSFIIMDIVVHGGITNIADIAADHIRLPEMTTIEQSSKPAANINLSYVEEEGEIKTGQGIIQINNADINYVDNPESIELFIEGANQFSIDVNRQSGQITVLDENDLPTVVGFDARYRVRQIQASLR